jgi:hypothetical protein
MIAKSASNKCSTKAKGGPYVAKSPPVVEEAAETTETVEAKRSKETNELKISHWHNVCTTIADKEDDELPKDSTDEHQD